MRMGARREVSSCNRACSAREERRGASRRTVHELDEVGRVKHREVRVEQVRDRSGVHHYTGPSIGQSSQHASEGRGEIQARKNSVAVDWALLLTDREPDAGDSVCDRGEPCDLGLVDGEVGRVWAGCSLGVEEGGVLRDRQVLHRRGSSSGAGRGGDQGSAG